MLANLINIFAVVSTISTSFSLRFAAVLVSFASVLSFSFKLENIRNTLGTKMHKSIDVALRIMAS